ncbi:tetraacyldisaccharide 4'-kinase [bacterium]|nr:tetraacyldisaccharide 4'-kinase [bacterium]
MNLKNKITKIHYDKNAKGLIFNILKLLSNIYTFFAEYKNQQYDKGILQPKKVDAKVISVGNLTTGGVGKTPVTCEIAKYLNSKGHTVAIVSRGYGGKLSNKNINVISDGKTIFYNAKFSGDEPFWLAKNTGCIVITSKNRFEASKYAIENFNSDIILLDDGFQHRKLYRDIDIILIDSVKQFGNGNLLPTGPLREGIKNILRADKILVVSKDTDHSNAENFAKHIMQKYKKDVQVCKIEPDYIYNIKTNAKLENGAKATAISAIGQPEQFYNFLKNYDIVDTVTFDDHHQYEMSELSTIEGNIITTEKDAVKLKEFNFDNIYALKLKTVLDVENLISKD